MGGDLQPPAAGKSPTFLVWAVKDPTAGNLDRIQIVKGWAKSGQSFEKVYDVVWAGDRKPDPVTGNVPAIGSTVDIVAATYTDSIGAVELKGTWTDPDFDPTVDAFYYLRAIAIPTPRWTTIQAKELGVPPPQNVSATVQERAWSSPIWYTPSAESKLAAERVSTVADLKQRGAEELDDEALKQLLVGKFVWVRNNVTGGKFKVYWAESGRQLVTNVDPRIPQPADVGDAAREAHLGRPTEYAIRNGRLVTSFGNREYETAFYRMGGGANNLGDKYFLARSNEFGYANYELIETPIFLGTEVTGAVVPK
jgi:hypothetical protein